MNDRMKNDEAKLREFLKPYKYVPENLDIYCFESTESTNKDAKLASLNSAPDSVFISKRQIAGRGRLGRSFSSEAGGLYMSLLFNRQMTSDEAMKITVCAAVAMGRALKKLTDLDVKIKWVNDIFIADKKLAGILCEGACNEFGQVTHAILGIGINLFKPSDPLLYDIATSISEHTDNVPQRLELAAEIIKELYDLANVRFDSVIEEYREKSCLIGRAVRVVKLSEEYSAIVKGIDDNGALITEKENGITELLTTGEVSIRF